SGLTLAELLAATRFVETDFFTFDFTSIARDVAGLLERRLERFVVVDEGAGNTVAHRTSLTAFTTAVNVDMKIERFQVVGEFQRLTHDHAAGLASKVFIDGLAIDNNLARTFFQEHAGYRRFTAPCSIVPITDHDLSLDFQRFGLL